MIRSPLSLRIQADPAASLRDQLYEAARLGFKGVVLDAAGDLNPERLGESARRDLRHQLRTIELGLFALNLPTNKPFDDLDHLEHRLERSVAAFKLAFELGVRLVTVRAGNIPAEADATRLANFTTTLAELSTRADHQGLRIAIDSATQPGSELKALLAKLASPNLGASVDPGSWLAAGVDPIDSILALGDRVYHAYGRDGAALARFGVPHPHGSGFATGTLDWESFLGALEEIAYEGPLTLWPDPGRPIRPQVEQALALINRF